MVHRRPSREMLEWIGGQPECPGPPVGSLEVLVEECISEDFEYVSRIIFNKYAFVFEFHLPGLIKSVF